MDPHDGNYKKACEYANNLAIHSMNTIPPDIIAAQWHTMAQEEPKQLSYLETLCSPKIESLELEGKTNKLIGLAKATAGFQRNMEARAPLKLQTTYKTLAKTIAKH